MAGNLHLQAASSVIRVCFVLNAVPISLEAMKTLVYRKEDQDESRMGSDRSRSSFVVNRLKEIGKQHNSTTLSVFTKAPVFTLFLHLTTAAATLHFITDNELGREDEWCFAWLHDKEMPACDTRR